MHTIQNYIGNIEGHLLSSCDTTSVKCFIRDFNEQINSGELEDFLCKDLGLSFKTNNDHITTNSKIVYNKNESEKIKTAIGLITHVLHNIYH